MHRWCCWLSGKVSGDPKALSWCLQRSTRACEQSRRECSQIWGLTLPSAWILFNRGVWQYTVLKVLDWSVPLREHELRGDHGTVTETAHQVKCSKFSCSRGGSSTRALLDLSHRNVGFHLCASVSSLGNVGQHLQEEIIASPFSASLLKKVGGGGAEYQFSSVQSPSHVWLFATHGLQHARLPCPSSATRLYSNSCPLSRDAIQPSHPLSSPSPAFNLAQHQGLFYWVNFSHQVAKVLEFQL